MPRVDYERHGTAYTRHRRPDPRIAAAVTYALGDAATVLNVGAGAGSYEPTDRCVLAVEPSAASITVHHWEPPQAGLAELGRAARDRVVVLTFDLAHLPSSQQDHRAWDAAHGHLRGGDSCAGSLRLVVAEYP